MVYSSTNTGLIEVWHNNKLLLRRKGPNTYAQDKHYPYFKWGIYKWGWSYTVRPPAVKNRVLFFSDVRVAGPSGNYQSVYPERLPENAVPVKSPKIKQ
ncbi:heparin lyase I family protein [Mucilaginibacter hurinus]